MIKFTFSDCYWVKCGLTAFSSFVFCRISYFDNYLTFEIFTEHIKRTAFRQLRTFCDDVKPFLSLLRVIRHQKKGFFLPPNWSFAAAVTVSLIWREQTLMDKHTSWDGGFGVTRQCTNTNFSYWCLQSQKTLHEQGKTAWLARWELTFLKTRLP